MRQRKVTVEEVMKTEGFRLVSTGGNCTAWEEPDTRMRVTQWGTPSAPEEMEDPVTLCIQENDNSGTLGEFVRYFASFTAFWHWYCTAEYLLPWNGEGYEANGWTYVEAR